QRGGRHRLRLPRSARGAPVSSTLVAVESDPPASAPPPSSRWLAELEKGSSLWRDAWRRLRKNRAAVVSGVLLVLMVIGCVLVPSLSHFHYDVADLKTGATPPSWHHWMGTDYFGRDLMAR